MHTTTSPGRQAAASGQVCLAASPAVSGSYGRLFVGAADAAQVAPFAAGWPHQTFLELGALPSAVPCARLHSRQVLWEWGLAEFSESAELLVAELATNAMQISRAAMQDDPIRLWLVSDKMQVVILVWDASPLPPVPMDADDDAESGRGLLLVQAVSARWGWHSPPGISGKVVWAQVTRADDGRSQADER
jgi:anti-sigma regulatory factor (Ser/Thr protein kinase)